MRDWKVSVTAIDVETLHQDEQGESLLACALLLGLLWHRRWGCSLHTLARIRMAECLILDR
jgi:hypothetical protein